MGAGRRFALGSESFGRASAPDLALAKPYRACSLVAECVASWNRGPEEQKVVCFSDNAPSFYARQPEFHAVRPFIDKWIARSRQAIREFLNFGIHAEFAPYCVDPKVFFRLPAGDADMQALRRQLGLPENSYVIGNFHSDTAFTLGPDRPKWQKGPDIFAEIVRQVREVEPAACVLLAGPRRHWLRQRLQDCGVPVFFVGRNAAGTISELTFWTAPISIVSIISWISA